MTEEGGLLLTTLAHDAFYDPAVGSLIGPFTNGQLESPLTTLEVVY